MTERFFEDINPIDIRERMETERSMAEYADSALANSVVSVNVENCKHPLIHLPKNVAESLADLPDKPNQVSGVDLQMTYDPVAQRFTTVNARLRLDTNYSLIFQRIQAKYFEQPDPLYNHVVTNPVNVLVRKSSSELPMRESEVNAILNAIGIDVPTSPQEASWDEIKAILQFAGLWSATTSNTAPINPATSVTISDHVEGSSMDSSTTTLAGDDGIRLREIVFSMDEAAGATEPPDTTWKLIARSNNRHETPCLVNMVRTPLEFRLPMIDDGIELLGAEPYVRHELTEQSVEVPLDNAFLQAARSAIAAASKLL